jgi:hypothetical protein
LTGFIFIGTKFATDIAVIVVKLNVVDLMDNSTIPEGQLPSNFAKIKSI